MFLKQLHDQGPALVQCSAQRRVRNPVQVSRGDLAFWTWEDRAAHQSTGNMSLMMWVSHRSYLLCQR